MTTRRDALKLLGGSAAMMMAGTAARAQAPSAADWDKVVAAAKKEGQVVLYTGITGGQQHPEIAKLFEKRYGIKVEIWDGAGSEAMTRIRTEVTTNRNLGDVSLIGSTGNVPMARQDLLLPHGDLPNLSKQMTFQVDLPDIEVPVFVNPYGLAVNTDMVPPEREPKSWLDLLDPYWQGKILAYRFTAAGSGASWFSVMLEKFGKEFHEKFAKQHITFSNTVRENPRRVARGEFAMCVPFTLTDIKALEGLPVKGVIPKEGIVYTPFTIAQIKGSPHPNAARLMLNFFLEPEAQAVYARDGYPVALAGLKADTPEKLRPIVEAKLLGRQAVDGHEDDRMRLAAQIYEGK